MKQYDLFFITSVPSFYKINLYNAIAKKQKVFVLFLAKNSQIRTDDFVNLEADFDYQVYSDATLETKKTDMKKFLNILNKHPYRYLILGGWDFIEYWVAALFSSKNKNCVAVESSIFESKTTGLAALLKKLFLKRISLGFASGSAQQNLLISLKFRGEIRITKGVGLLHTKEFQKSSKKHAHKFLYVGRLAPEKNLSALIEVFNRLPNYSLTLVGKGELKDALQQQSNANIHFVEHIPNQEIDNVYLSHDVLILPSLSEPWGLVVEEALYYGLPVVISNKVGCSEDLVLRYSSGIVYDNDDPGALEDAVLQIAADYRHYAENVSSINFQERFNDQVTCYDL
jgi:glycosyltransferase involved in cell wall biosynthesis